MKTTLILPLTHIYRKVVRAREAVYRETITERTATRLRALEKDLEEAKAKARQDNLELYEEREYIEWQRENPPPVHYDTPTPDDLTTDSDQGTSEEDEQDPLASKPAAVMSRNMTGKEGTGRKKGCGGPCGCAVA